MADLFEADFEVLLYDLTSTYFEGEMEQNRKAKRGYSRDGRPDCLQVVIALVITPDGFPLAYEVISPRLPPTATPRRCPYPDRLPGLLSAGDAEKPAHDSKRGCVLCHVDCAYIFRQFTAGNLHVELRKAQQTIKRFGAAERLELGAGHREPSILLWPLLVDQYRVHDSIRAGVWERVDQNCIDQAEHRRRCPDTECQREDRDNGETWILPKRAQAIANITPKFMPRLKADGCSVLLLLYSDLAELNLRSSFRFLYRDAALDEVLGISIHVKPKLIFNIAIDA